MKKSIIAVVILIGLLHTSANAQTDSTQTKFTSHNKGKFFVSWGGNRDNFTKSDITFQGKDYNFTLNNVTAHDKPKGWHIDYVNPSRITIPQTNFRLGYFINDHYSLAIALDHMKYVIYQDVAVKIDGYYPNIGSYDELISGKPNEVLVTEKFLKFEHTDGLNYVHTEFSRQDDVSTIFKIANTDKIQINLTEGVGFGLLYPKTNATLLGKPRHDDFHVSGYGTSLKAGVNFTFYKHFYIQGELKGGYINMQDIRTTQSTDDRASQDFFFFQRIIEFGGIFKL